MVQECLIQCKNGKKKRVKCKTKGIFFKKISWSQMIQNCLIRQELAKNIYRIDAYM